MSSATLLRVPGHAEAGRLKLDRSLGDEKDLVCIGIAHLGSRREPTHIHVTLIRSIRTGDEPWFVRHRNPVRNIAFGLLDRGSCCGDFWRRRRLHRGVIWRRRGWSRRLKRLLHRWITIGRRLISGPIMGWWWLWLGTGSDKQCREERKRNRLFHTDAALDVSQFSKSFVGG